MKARTQIKAALKAARESDEPEESEGGLVSLKLGKKDKEKRYPIGSPVQDDYSYNTRITLRKEELEKLGVDELPKVGEKFRLVADVEVCSVSASASKDNDNKEMGLQITAMKLD